MSAEAPSVVASLERTIHRVLDRLAVDSAPLAFAAFLEAHPELLRRDLLSAHYSEGLLFSERARDSFLEPDLAPLPAA